MSVLKPEIIKEIKEVAQSNFIDVYQEWYHKIDTQYNIYLSIAPQALNLIRTKTEQQLAPAEVAAIKVFLKHLYTFQAYGSSGRGKISADYIFAHLGEFMEYTKKIDAAIQQNKPLGEIFRSADIVKDNKNYKAIKQRAISIMMGLTVPSLFNWSDYKGICDYIGLPVSGFPDGLIILFNELNQILQGAGVNDKIASYIFPWVVYAYFQGDYMDREARNAPRLFSTLHLPNYTVSSFYNSLKTKGFVILAGTSGTGKTKIIEEFVKQFKYQNEVLTSDENLIKIKTSKSYFEYYYLNIPLKYAREDLFLVPDLTVGENSMPINLYAGGKQYPANIYRRPTFIRITGLSNFYADFKNPVEFYLKPKIDTKSDNKFLGYEVVFDLKALSTSKAITNFLFFPVRPDFRDSKSLFGYYNPLDKQYHTTPLLEFMQEAADNYLEHGEKAAPHFVLFDEMNLARVEHYFSDVLSVMESKKIVQADIDGNELSPFLIKMHGVKGKNVMGFSSGAVLLHNSDEEIEIPQQLHLSPNLYFVGTVNVDETSYVFSPKVLDRAFTIEFDVDNLESYVRYSQIGKKRTEIKEIQTDFVNEGKFSAVSAKALYADYPASVREDEELDPVGSLELLNQILTKYGYGFGYRVVDEVLLYLSQCKKSPDIVKGLTSEYENFDLAIKMKILPKLHGSRQKLETAVMEILQGFTEVEVSTGITLEELLRNTSRNGVPSLKREQGEYVLVFPDYTVSTSYPHTTKKLFELFYKLQVNGFASFI